MPTRTRLRRPSPTSDVQPQITLQPPVTSALPIQGAASSHQVPGGEQPTHQELPESYGHHLAEISVLPPGVGSSTAGGPVTVQSSLPDLSAGSEQLPMQRQKDLGTQIRSRLEDGSPLAVQRYMLTNAYTFAGAVGTSLFSSQGLRHGAGMVKELHRRDVTIGAAGGLVEQDETYRGAALGWQAMVGPAAVNRPQIKVSENRRLAIEDTGQATVFYVDHGLIATANQALTQGGAEFLVVQVPGGTTLTVAPGTPQQRTLVQASIAMATQPNDVADGLGVYECNDVARKIINNNINPALPSQRFTPDRNAQPGVGEAYGFSSEYEDEWKNQRQLNKRISQDPAAFTAKMDEMMQQLLPIYDQIGTGVAVNWAGVGRKARGALPGWGSHFEGVIAADGHDRITLANYNRITEIKFEKRRIFIELYNAHRAQFSAAFTAHIQQKLAQNPNLTWRDVLNEMVPFVSTDIIVNTLVPHLTQSMSALAMALNSQKEELWYFEMYGVGAQSFHAKYKQYARGAGRSTRIIR